MTTGHWQRSVKDALTNRNRRLWREPAARPHHPDCCRCNHVAGKPIHSNERGLETTHQHRRLRVGSSLVIAGIWRLELFEQRPHLIRFPFPFHIAHADH
jgi:hypothetical protein